MNNIADSINTIQQRFNQPEDYAQKAAEHWESVAREIEALRFPSLERRFSGIVGPAYAGCRLSNFVIDPSWPRSQQGGAIIVTGSLSLIAANIREAVKVKRRGIVLIGPPGVGKDHLAAAMMWSANEAGLSVKWTNGAKFAALATDQASYSTRLDSRDWLRQWVAPDVLTISDPDGDRSKLSDLVSDSLYNVVDARVRDGKPTWITINGESEQECASRLGGRVWDRLIDGAVVRVCLWASHRQTVNVGGA